MEEVLEYGKAREAGRLGHGTGRGKGEVTGKA